MIFESYLSFIWWNSSRSCRARPTCLNVDVDVDVDVDGVDDECAPWWHMTVVIVLLFLWSELNLRLNNTIISFFENIRIDSHVQSNYWSCATDSLSPILKSVRHDNNNYGAWRWWSWQTCYWYALVSGTILVDTDTLKIGYSNRTNERRNNIGLVLLVLYSSRNNRISMNRVVVRDLIHSDLFLDARFRPAVYNNLLANEPSPRGQSGLFLTTRGRSESHNWLAGFGRQQHYYISFVFRSVWCLP